MIDPVYLSLMLIYPLENQFSRQKGALFKFTNMKHNTLFKTYLMNPEL
jgi:hypothetical protein